MKKRKEGSLEYPKTAYLYVPDPESPSTWALRVWESLDTEVTRAQLGRAAAALSPAGFRGQQADIPSDDLPAVKAKLRTLYKSLDVPDDEVPPHVLKESAHPEELGRWYHAQRQRLTEAGAAHTKAEIALIDELMDGHDAMKGKLGQLRRSPRMTEAGAAGAMKRAYNGQMQEMMAGQSKDSLDGKRAAVQDAYRAAFPSSNQAMPTMSDSGYIEETFDDRIIVCKGNLYWQIPYTEADGVYTWGEPVEVAFSGAWGPVKESLVLDADDARLIESASADGSEWIVRLIKPGWSKNRSAALKLPRYYPEATLKEATPSFDGLSVFAHFTKPHIDHPGEQSAQAKIGWLSEPKYEGGTVARFTCVDASMRGKLKEAWDKGKRDFLGFSMDAPGREEVRVVEGRKAAWVAEIGRPHEMSMVTNPAAGGEFLRLVASADVPKEEDSRMLERLLESIRKINPALLATVPAGGWTEESLTAILQEAITPKAEVKPVAIPDVARLAEAEKKIDDKLKAMEAKEKKTEAISHFRESVGKHAVAQHPAARRLVEARGMAEIEGGKELTPEQITAMADEQMAVLAEASQSGKVSGLGKTQVGADEREKMIVSGMDGLFEGRDMNEVPRFTSLHEAFCKITGRNYFDLDNRTIFKECIGVKAYDSAGRRLTESVVSGDWAEIFGDSVTRKMVRDYRQSTQYDAWRSLVSEVSSPKDFRTQRRPRLGGYGLLPAVLQGAPYQPLTSPGDEEATFTPSKRGGTEDLTWEAVLNDDIGAIRQIPIRLARAAKITLYRFVMDLIRTNPTIYDGVVLHHTASHANINDAVLSAANLLAAENFMLAQAAYGEATNNLGLTPRYLLVVRALRDTAWKLTTGDTAVISAETATTPNIFKGKYRTFQGNEQGEPFHVLNYETSTTAYYLIADPQEIPTIEVGFLGGQQEPELFVQDDERVGSRFSADKITNKIRHVYSGMILDYRGFVRGNV